MRHFNTFLLYSLLIITASFSQAANRSLPADTSRITFPLNIDYGNNTVTPFIDIIINHKKFKAVFDTGSSGLRMMSAALTASVKDTTNQRVSYTYGDNARSLSLRGRVVHTQISFSDKVASSLSISAMSIDSSRYGPAGNWIPTGDSTVINSNHFRSCSAILGVGLRTNAKSAEVVSPFRQIPGNGKFIVQFPRYGGSKGNVIINPTADDETGFTYFQLLPGKATSANVNPGWVDNQLPGCISIDGTQACLPTLLDTGSPDIIVFAPQFTDSHNVPSGDVVALQLGDPKDTAFIKTNLLISKPKEPGKDYVHLTEIHKAAKMIFGTRFFFEFDVLYDQQNGVIGIRKKK